MTMTLKSFAIAVVACVGLTACDAPQQTQTLNISAPPGASASAALNGFTQAVGTAEAIAIGCASQGIRRNYTDSRSVSRQYVQNLVAQGYSLQELTAASRNLDNNASTQRAIAYLKKRGVREGDLNSLCAVGRKEIAEGTTVGKLLRLG